MAWGMVIFASRNIHTINIDDSGGFGQDYNGACSVALCFSLEKIALHIVLLLLDLILDDFI